MPRIDHTLLAATTTAADVDGLLARALADTSPDRGVVVPPVFAKRAVDALRNTGLRVASVAGYPLGLAKPTIKAIEATNLAKDGVDAIELTPLLANLLTGDFEAMRAELLEVVRGVRAARPTATVHVRLDLDLIPPTHIDVAAWNDAIIRGACDGIVLESSDPTRSTGVLEKWPTSPLQRKLGPAAVRPLRLNGVDAVGLRSDDRQGT